MRSMTFFVAILLVGLAPTAHAAVSTRRSSSKGSDEHHQMKMKIIEAMFGPSSENRSDHKRNASALLTRGPEMKVKADNPGAQPASNPGVEQTVKPETSASATNHFKVGDTKVEVKWNKGEPEIRSQKGTKPEQTLVPGHDLDYKNFENLKAAAAYVSSMIDKGVYELVGTSKPVDPGKDSRDVQLLTLRKRVVLRDPDGSTRLDEVPIYAYVENNRNASARVRISAPIPEEKQLILDVERYFSAKNKTGEDVQVGFIWDKNPTIYAKKESTGQTSVFDLETLRKEQRFRAVTARQAEDEMAQMESNGTPDEGPTVGTPESSRESGSALADSYQKRNKKVGVVGNAYFLDRGNAPKIVVFEKAAEDIYRKYVIDVSTLASEEPAHHFSKSGEGTKSAVD